MPPKKAKNKRMLVILGVFVVAVLAYVIFISFGSSVPEDEFFVINPSKEDFSKVDIDILDNQALEDFNSWPVIPVEAGETGKVNPFAQ